MDDRTASGTIEAGPPLSLPRPLTTLIGREAEMAAVVALPLEAAVTHAALSISRRTATNHLACILAKFDVPRRAVAAREAERRGLV